MKECTSLYKYVGGIDAIESIVKGELKLTPPKFLNDPSELFPIFDREEVSNSLQHLGEAGFSEDDYGNLESQLALLKRFDSSFSSDSMPDIESLKALVGLFNSDLAQFGNNDFVLRYLEESLHQIVEIISDNIGIFCLSEDLNSLPMWAHYANNAKGFVVEYDGVELGRVFAGDKTGVLHQLVEVDYNRENYRVTFITNSHRQLFFTKYADWKYEQEVRILLPLENCRSVSNSEGLYLYQLKKNPIKRIVLGWNMDDSTKIEILKRIKRVNSGIEVCSASLDFLNTKEKLKISYKKYKC